MLGLKMETDPRWVNIVEKNISEILTDHAWCEQKAASNAISLIVRYPEYPDLVSAMVEISREEMEHFGQVQQKIIERGYELGKERKDPYVHDLIQFIRRGGSYEGQLVDRLLFAAMIEARSCERFRLLSQKINDEDLRQFYHDLMVSEANHYTLFIRFARKYGKSVDVDKRWEDFLAYEAKIIKNYGKEETIHG